MVAPCAIEAMSAPGEVLAHLRAVTRPAHVALDAALGVLDERLDIAGYRALLVRFYGFWVGWQPQVAALLQDAALMEPRRRLHLLVADLAELGVSGPALAALPRCPPTPLDDAMAGLGSLYVMEGSTLGGRVIQRHVEHRLGERGRRSCRYFGGYGAETGVMWRSLLARLDVVPQAAVARVGGGAAATFDCLGRWLTREAEPSPRGGIGRVVTQ